MKTQIRHKYLLQRDAMSSAEVQALGAQIRANFNRFSLLRVPEGRSVMLYASFRNEADTWGILADLWAKKVPVLLPRTLKEGLSVHVYSGPESLKKSAFGILEPDPALCPAGDLSSVALVLVPGVVFDRRGGRVGFGAGYYDRFLPQVPEALRVGLCYEAQIAEEVPCEETDILMDYLLTEQGLFNCKTQSYTAP